MDPATIVDAAPDAIFAIDADRVVRSWNPAAASLLGRCADDAIGRPAQDLLAEPADDVLAAPPVIDRRTCLLRPDGSRAAVSLSAAAGPDGDLVVVARPLTPAGGLAAFAAAAAHDLREPLRVIQLAADVLHAGAEGRDREQLLDVIRATAVRATEQVEHMLALAGTRGANGAMALVTDAGTALDDALAALDVALRERGATVERRRLPAMPIERPLLAGVLQNLVANAVKHAPSDRTPHIEVTGRTRDGVVELHVSDNGDGIAPDAAGDLLRLFTRGARATARGNGVGLAAVRMVVESRGGTVTIEPAAGGGTNVVLRFPDPWRS